MNLRHVLLSLLFICATLAFAFGLYLFNRPDTMDVVRMADAVLPMLITAFGGILLVLALAVRHALVESDRKRHLLRRKVDELQLRGDFERGQAEVLEKISSLIEVFNTTRDLDAVLRQAVAALRSILSVDVIVLQLYSDVETRFFARIEDGAHDVDLGAAIRHDVVELGRSRLINRIESHPRFAELVERGYYSIIVSPLQRAKQNTNSGTVGLIAALSRTPRDFVSHELNLLATFASQAGLIIEDAHLYKKTEHLALHDGLLTEIFNRRYFIDTLEREIDAAQTSGDHVALVMVDIDDFKRHNDTYGHQCGDAALRTVANILLDNTRGLDVVARFGGEEFMIILPETDRQGALTVAETIRSRVDEYEFATPKGTPAELTISIGVAIYKDDADSATELISSVDQALYRAKDHGKNQVVSAAAPSS
jgi:diguanylate cyclase (GGDEF)-like protein